MPEATLLQTAEREANEAEADWNAMSDEEKAVVKSKPGEQGIATQENEPAKKPRVWDRSPTQQEIVFADDYLQKLRHDSQEMGAEGVIDALVKVLDVHPHFQMPHEWPGEAEDTLTKAPLLKSLGTFLAKGCAKIEISPTKVLWLWKNKKTWTKQGEQIRCQAKKLSDVGSHLAGGAVAVVIGNFQLFRLLNTRQKIAAIYHALRTLDAEGNIRPNQFEGFFDEIQLFGTGTFQTDVLLRRAIEHGAQRELPFEETVSQLASTATLDPNEREEEEEDEEA